MTWGRLRCRVRGFGVGEAGSATMEFVILVPVIFSVFLMAFELGVLHLRQAMLGRALDLVVRDVRLGTGTPPDFETFRARICQQARVIPDCEQVIRVEMRALPPGAWGSFDGPVRCVDRTEEIDPARDFAPGRENELMFVRVCALFEPAFPSARIGFALQKNAQGEYGLLATSAFVNEPGDAS